MIFNIRSVLTLSKLLVSYSAHKIAGVHTVFVTIAGASVPMISKSGGYYFHAGNFGMIVPRLFLIGAFASIRTMSNVQKKFVVALLNDALTARKNGTSVWPDV